MYNLVSILLGLIFFIATVTAYSLGIKHGRIVRNDGVPNVNPVKAVQQIKQDKEIKKQMDLFTEGLNNILSYGEEETKKK